MTDVIADPMSDEELQLYRAQRALHLWQSGREVAVDDVELTRLVYDHLRRRCSTAGRAVRVEAMRRGASS